MEEFPSIDVVVESYKRLGIFDFIKYVRSLAYDSGQPQRCEMRMGLLLGCEVKLVVSFDPDLPPLIDNKPQVNVD